MNSPLASLADLAALIQPMLSAFLLPLVVAIPIVALFVTLFTVRSAKTRVQPDAEPQADTLPAAPPAAPAMQEVPRAPTQRAPTQPAPTQPAPAQPAPTSTPQRRPASILLVDDSAVARAKLLKLFQVAGFDAVAARDGVEAMDALSRAHFSVLVTDLEMPNMNGFELIAAVQGSLETEDMPIIAITGHDELQARVHELGGLYGIFKKPWNDRDLLRRVQSLATLRKRPEAAAA